MSLTDPNFSIAIELGKLSVKDLELKNLQYDLTKAKQNILEKEKILNDNLDNQESLKQQLESMKDSLSDAKHIIWDHLAKEIKLLKDYLIQVEDEKQVAISRLANVLIVQESMGDKPFQAQSAINYLNSRTKA